MLFKLVLTLLFFSSALFSKEPVPIAIIGSGPAGLSAALTAGRERIDTHLFTGSKPGGPVNAITCLSNWPGSVPGKGNVVMERVFKQLARYPVTLHSETISRIDLTKRPFRLVTETGKTHLAETVIIATGAVPRTLGVPGEGEIATHTYVYKTDAPNFSGQTVAVIGGGLDASKKAKILSKTAKKVYLIVRKGQMQKPFMEKQRPNVEIFYNTEVTAVSSGLVILNTNRTLPVDSLVLALGIEPNTQLVGDQLFLEEDGAITLLGRTQMTSVPGVFAAGNVADTHYRQAATSAAEGMRAAYDALEFLQMEIKE